MWNAYLREHDLVIRVDDMRADTAVSGTVVATGSSASELSVGDQVFGTHAFKDPYRPLAICRQGSVVPKPAKLSHREAGLLVNAGTMALRAVRLAGLQRGDRLAVADASSMVGALVVQIARARECHVTGVCRDRDVPLVWDLGADEVFAVERRGDDLNAFDGIVITDARFREECRPGLSHYKGRLLMIGTEATLVSEEHRPPRNVPHTAPEEDDLRELARLVEAGSLFPLGDEE